MKIKVATGLDVLKSDCLIVPLLKGQDVPGDILSLSKKTIAIALEDFGGDAGETVGVYLPDGGLKRLLLVGLGEAGDRDMRAAGAAGASWCANRKLKSIALLLPNDSTDPDADSQAVVEGCILASYRFDMYRTDKKEKASQSLTELVIVTGAENARRVRKHARAGREIALATTFARDLVNLAPGEKTATELARRARRSAVKFGVKATVWTKKRIEKERMGGLLAVNRGSIDPPTFTVLEWKPERCRNKKPVVLVGKGVVFDTGGLSLKPTLNSMDKMKYDMAGAAAVIGAMEGVARLKLPVHVIALIPATDNRPGRRAYAPGEVVKMHSGATVEVLNTDAEGRMILADALSYAKSLKPELVVDAATLTGAQVVALGSVAAAVMANEDAESEGHLDAMIEAGQHSGDRVAPLPMFDEYASLLKSEVADIKNVGGREAGSITAAKFLQHFVAYPWIHLDIAGPAYSSKDAGHLRIGGTGFGVRLLLEFLRGYKK